MWRSCESLQARCRIRIILKRPGNSTRHFRSAKCARGRTPIEAGDAFLFKPGEPHQLINDSESDLVICVVADNPIGESTFYPDSQKWGVRSPERRLIRSGPLQYYDGEE
jgi:uncharacterized cupin superfamily protein